MSEMFAVFKVAWRLIPLAARILIVAAYSSVFVVVVLTVGDCIFSEHADAARPPAERIYASGTELLSRSGLQESAEEDE